MIHSIRVEAWGDRVAVVCDVCTVPGAPATALVRARAATGLTLADVVTVAEQHGRDHPDSLSADDLAATEAALEARGQINWDADRTQQESSR